MIIGGLQKTTLIDFPGKLACTVFLSGCNFRCPWCYSAELVLPAKIINQPRIAENVFFDFLRERRGLLEGVVICGGEPTINNDLPQFVEKIKNLGFSVKLDTNGSNPKMLNDLIAQKLIDYVAMDIKVPKEKYAGYFGKCVDIKDIEASVEMLKKIPETSEFRTTIVPGVHEKEDFVEIAKWIGGPEVKYYLQGFRPEKTIDPKFSAQGAHVQDGSASGARPASGGEKIKPYPDAFLKKIAEEISPHFKLCQLR